MKKDFLILCFFFPTLVFSQTLPYFSISEAKARELFKKALVYYHKKKYSLASEYFLKSSFEKPDFFLSKKKLADSYYLDGKWLESLGTLVNLNDDKYRFINKSSIKNQINFLKYNLAEAEIEEENQDLTYYSQIDLKENKLYRCLNPTDVQVDEDDNIFVLCLNTNNIIKFSPNSKPLRNIFNVINSFKGSLFFKVYKEKFYISNFQNDQIMIVDNLGRNIDNFGKSGSQNGEFHGPSGIDIDKNENIFIADAYNNRIQKFDITKNFIKSFGDDFLKEPSGLHISQKNEIFVIDKGNNRVVCFDENGNFLYDLVNTDFTSIRDIHSHKNKIFVTDEKKGIFIYDLISRKWNFMNSFMDNSLEKNYFLNPFGVYINKKGNLYISELLNHKIHSYSFKNKIFSNLNLYVENININSFPRVDISFNIRTNDNKTVNGLLDSDIFIFENNNRKAIQSFVDLRNFDKNIHTNIIIENSQELKNEEYIVNSILNNLYQNLDKNDQIGYLKAGKDSKILSKVKNVDIKDLENLSIKKVDNTIFLSKSLNYSITDLLNFIGSRSIVVFVSGKKLNQSFKHFNISKIIFYAKAHSIPIHFLSLSSTGEQNEIYKEIANKTNGKFINIKNNTYNINLNSILRKAKEKRYIISYDSELDKTKINDYYIPIRISANYQSSKAIGYSGFFLQ